MCHERIFFCLKMKRMFWMALSDSISLIHYCQSHKKLIIKISLNPLWSLKEKFTHCNDQRLNKSQRDSLRKSKKKKLF